MRRSKPRDLASDATREWEICSIVGQKTVVNEVYYRVNWEPTWMPESELEGARELIDKFTARLQPERHEGCNGYSDGGRSERG
jgi:hypothetical protein